MKTLQNIFSKQSRYTLLLFCTISVSLSAQHEDKVWYFGAFGAGLDFRGCSLEVKNDGRSESNAVMEGMVSMCDRNTGRLLFYVIGFSIVDSTHQLMPNGAYKGNGNSTTQQLIVRKPGSNTIFYYISPDAQAGLFSLGASRGLEYAVIDMSLNNGKGDVVSHNIPIKDTCNTEKLTGITHANGTDIWMVAHEYRNNNFLVYSITSAGINTVCQVYSVGPVIPQTPSNLSTIGELKASPDGTKLAFVSLTSDSVCLLDFNKSTGAISNPRMLPGVTGMAGYGISFSPDNLKLYATFFDFSSPGMAVNSSIIQYDLSAGTTSQIIASKTLIYNCPTCSYRSIKLGPDGRIYVAKRAPSSVTDGLWLGVIGSPNNAGIACGFTNNAVYLGSLMSFGLNNAIETGSYTPFSTSTVSALASSTSVCIESVVTLSATGNASLFQWQPGGLTATTFSLLPTQSSTYTLSAFSGLACKMTSTIAINVLNCTAVSKHNTRLECEVYVLSNRFITVKTSLEANIILYDLVGNKIARLHNSLASGLESTSQMPLTGVYYVVIEQNEEREVRKVLVFD